jgi:hypothetical protein
VIYPHYTDFVKPIFIFGEEYFTSYYFRVFVTVEARRLANSRFYRYILALATVKKACKRYHFGLLPNHFGKFWHLPTPVGKRSFCLAVIMLCKCVFCDFQLFIEHVSLKYFAVIYRA